ncbi:hypothetical protein M378DRAFT_336345 [Amanita muscaria Koide BX008]|uniref:Uncharacterized protein n=1 Tax=Amanita muscaria (strain Koide BX008) TaxID=946122 RepID=A0A0C2WPR3_AMAMK|nr:hypothetical protein M378DRAFT_336345 [Amanita muscaria Koide BX008]
MSLWTPVGPNDPSSSRTSTWIMMHDSWAAVNTLWAGRYATVCVGVCEPAPTSSKPRNHSLGTESIASIHWSENTWKPIQLRGNLVPIRNLTENLHI